MKLSWGAQRCHHETEAPAEAEERSRQERVAADNWELDRRLGAEVAEPRAEEAPRLVEWELEPPVAEYKRTGVGEVVGKQPPANPH